MLSRLRTGSFLGFLVSETGCLQPSQFSIQGLGASWRVIILRGTLKGPEAWFSLHGRMAVAATMGWVHLSAGRRKTRRQQCALLRSLYIRAASDTHWLPRAGEDILTQPFLPRCPSHTYPEVYFLIHSWSSQADNQGYLHSNILYNKT